MNVPQLPALGDLLDPDAYTAPLVLGRADRGALLRQLRTMLLIRKAEERIGDAVTAEQLHCPCHLGIGQEAIAVGVASHLRKTDRVFGGHRSHSQYLAQGSSVFGLFAEVLGREAGCSKGMGGSMHLYDASHGFMGSVPIVAATVPLAVGAGLAAQKDHRGDIATVYFGDGAAEEGCVHEAMNFAATFRLPVLFVCENNLFSSHQHIELRQPTSSIARFAQAHCIPFEVVDGNDVVVVADAASRLIARGREGQGPGFLEAVTYRWRGHVGAREDIDVGVKRKDDLSRWKRRDPVARLVQALQRDGALNADRYAALCSAVDEEVAEAWRLAEAAPSPPIENLLSFVYSPHADA